MDPGVHPHACIPAVPGHSSDGKAAQDGEVSMLGAIWATRDGRSALALQDLVCSSPCY